MKITVHKNNRIESNIRPPMPMVVTLPLQRDGVDAGAALYVVASPFSRIPMTVVGLKDLADAVSDAINGKPKTLRPTRRGRKVLLESLRKHLLMELASFNTLGDRVSITVDGKPISADEFIKERTRLWRNTWVLPLIDELLEKEAKP